MTIVVLVSYACRISPTVDDFYYWQQIITHEYGGEFFDPLTVCSPSRKYNSWNWYSSMNAYAGNLKMAKGCSGFKPSPQISHLSPLLKSNILSGVHLWFRVSSMHVQNITTEWTDGDLLYALLRMLKMNNVIPSEWSMETNVRNEQRSILICKVEDWVRAHES